MLDGSLYTQIRISRCSSVLLYSFNNATYCGISSGASLFAKAPDYRFPVYKELIKNVHYPIVPSSYGNARFTFQLLFYRKMPAKKKQVFVTPFSSQKTQDGAEGNDPLKQRKQTPVGSFFFPVSASRIEKIQHVTPMTRKKIRQGLSKAIGTFPQGLDPKSPAVTFLTVSQATESGEVGAHVEEILDEIDELLSDNEAMAADIGK